jgi:hypothetical protein
MAEGIEAALVASRDAADALIAGCRTIRRCLDRSAGSDSSVMDVLCLAQGHAAFERRALC